MKNHYVTFGQIHIHRVNGKTFDCETVAVYQAENAQEGRKRVFELFGDKFFTDFHGEQWKEEDLKWYSRGYLDVDNEIY